MTKEEAYDTLVNPLMAQVIALCKEHKIAMLANFALDDEGCEDGLHCTTSLLEDEFQPTESQLAALRVILNGPARSPLMITTRNASGEITMIESIL